METVKFVGILNPSRSVISFLLELSKMMEFEGFSCKISSSEMNLQFIFEKIPKGFQDTLETYIQQNSAGLYLCS